MTAFGTRKEYGQWKAQTLADRFEQAQEEQLALDIFRGVTVWVDGFAVNESAKKHTHRA